METERVSIQLDNFSIDVALGLQGIENAPISIYPSCIPPISIPTSGTSQPIPIPHKNPISSSIQEWEDISCPPISDVRFSGYQDARAQTIPSHQTDEYIEFQREE